MFIFMIIMLLVIFLTCFFGNELTVASSKLQHALFESKWIDGNQTLRKNMKMFMENAKNEIKFTTFGLFKANLETFTAIVHAAFSLFAVLKNINN